MAKSDLEQARADLGKIRSEVAKLAADFQKADKQLEEKRASIGDAVLDGGDLKKLTAQLTSLEQRRGGLSAVLEVAREREKASAALVRNLEREADDKLWAELLKDNQGEGEWFMALADEIDARRFKKLESNNQELGRISGRRLDNTYKYRARQAQEAYDSLGHVAARLRDAAEPLIIDA